MDALLVGLQRRLICAAVLAACGWLGLDSDQAKTWAQNVTLAACTFAPMAGLVWSYFGKASAVPFSRRLVAGVVPIAYALLGALDLGMSDAERAGFAESLKQLLEAVVGNPPPELLAAMGLAGAGAVSSHFVANRLQPSSPRLATRNP